METTEVKKSRVTVTRTFVGLCWMQVCAISDATDKEILDVCNAENPSGTTHGWCRVLRETEEKEKARPVQCLDDPTRTHFLVEC